MEQSKEEYIWKLKILKRQYPGKLVSLDVSNLEFVPLPNLIALYDNSVDKIKNNEKLNKLVLSYLKFLITLDLLRKTQNFTNPDAIKQFFQQEIIILNENRICDKVLTLSKQLQNDLNDIKVDLFDQDLINFVELLESTNNTNYIDILNTHESWCDFMCEKHGIDGIDRNMFLL